MYEFGGFINGKNSRSSPTRSIGLLETDALPVNTKIEPKLDPDLNEMGGSDELYSIVKTSQWIRK